MNNFAFKIRFFFLLPVIMASETSWAECTNYAFSPSEIIAPSDAADHMGFPSMVKFNNELYIAIRESKVEPRRQSSVINLLQPVRTDGASVQPEGIDQVSGHHYGGHVVIYKSVNLGTNWTREHTLSLPRLGQSVSNVTNPYNANDIRDFTLSVKPASGANSEKLSLTMVAVNQNGAAEVFNKNGLNAYERVQFSVYTEFDPTNNIWSDYQKISGANDDYWFYSTKWTGDADKSYSLAYVAGPIAPTTTFNTGGVSFFSSLDGVNYGPDAVVNAQGIISGGQYTPYASNVSPPYRHDGTDYVLKNGQSFLAGANEADFAFLDDGSIVAIARKRDNEKSYFFLYSEGIGSKWELKEIGFPDDEENQIGIHGMELLKLDNGIILAAYRRINFIADQKEEFCTVISWLNTQTGELKEIGAVEGIDHFDIGYPTMLVDDDVFYFAQYERFHPGIFTNRGSYTGTQPFSRISFFKMPLDDLYKKISASMYTELEPLRQFLNSTELPYSEE